MNTFKNMIMKSSISKQLYNMVKILPYFWYFPNLKKNTLTVRNIEFLKKAMNWTLDPLLDDPQLNEFDYLEDLNDRRIRDAEIIGTVCCNSNAKILLEIGTASGHSTALMAQNAPDGVVYTVNLPPEEAKFGGNLITNAPSYGEIGSYYKEKGMKNIKQIYANTAKWEPDFGPIDIAFIDGCHDADFVFNDTRKVLKKCKVGSIILWHDFSLEKIQNFFWTSEVARGIEKLYNMKMISGRILHLQDSWIGFYQVTEQDLNQIFKN
jgi:predicted O-methyltransferase YrrM